MFDVTGIREGQTFRIRCIKGSPSFHRWCQRIGLKVDGEFEIRRVIPMILLHDDAGQPPTWIEFMVNGHLIRLSNEEFSRLDVEPCIESAMVSAGHKTALCVV